MSDINIRNLDPQLVAKVKAKAAMEGKTLKDAVIDLFKEYTRKKNGKKIDGKQ